MGTLILMTILFSETGDLDSVHHSTHRYFGLLGLSRARSRGLKDVAKAVAPSLTLEEGKV